MNPAEVMGEGSICCSTDKRPSFASIALTEEDWSQIKAHSLNIIPASRLDLQLEIA